MYCEYHRLVDEVIERAVPYPAHRFQGRGIVTCAGGPRFFTCAWVLVRVLRDVLKTPLPIQVWHRGATEIDPPMRALLERHNVEVVDACAIESPRPPSHRWALKPFAILHSRFQEVLFLDADNVPAVDPTRLFLGDKFVTCRLTRHEDGVWRGRWLRYERDPVELIPWQA